MCGGVKLTALDFILLPSSIFDGILVDEASFKHFVGSLKTFNKICDAFTAYVKLLIENLHVSEKVIEQQN